MRNRGAGSIDDVMRRHPEASVRLEPQLVRGWEYARSANYHRELDPGWSYAPTYRRKMKAVEAVLRSLPSQSSVLDAGCGEGVSVQLAAELGLRACGVDLFTGAPSIPVGDLRAMPFAPAAFDAVLLNDVLEHFSPIDQPQVLAEIHRVLRPGGLLFVAVPNLAHLTSRVALLLLGRLDRTDRIENHVGERPLVEYRGLIADAGFSVLSIRGITLTVPILYRRMIARSPERFGWLHDLLEPLADRLPSLAMLSVLRCRRGE